MALLGQGAFVAWHGIAAGREADYDRWHSHEHMLERVAIPGFLRGRRYVAAADRPRYLVVYEVADVGVLTSPAYLERLDNPTAWTREVMPAVCDMNRTLCRVEASFGRGVGHAALTVRISPVPNRANELDHWLRAELERSCGSPGLTGAHLLRADAAASRTPTREKQLRAQPGRGRRLGAAGRGLRPDRRPRLARGRALAGDAEGARRPARRRRRSLWLGLPRDARRHPELGRWFGRARTVSSRLKLEPEHVDLPPAGGLERGPASWQLAARPRGRPDPGFRYALQENQGSRK